jgi:hypothetical protein
VIVIGMGPAGEAAAGRLRGQRAHAQLFGGEVTLIDPDDHAAALRVMRAHGRER